jgi:hypothetical protein
MASQYFSLQFVRVDTYPVPLKDRGETKPGKGIREDGASLNKQTDRFRNSLIVVDHTIKSHASERTFGGERMMMR